jgi:hypothetical protein
MQYVNVCFMFYESASVREAKVICLQADNLGVQGGILVPSTVSDNPKGEP